MPSPNPLRRLAGAFLAVAFAGCATHANTVDSSSKEGTRLLAPPLPSARFDVVASEIRIEQDGAWQVDGELTRREVAHFLDRILDSANPQSARARFRLHAVVSGSSALLADVTLDLEIGQQHLRATGRGGAYAYELGSPDGGVGLAIRRAIRKAVEELGTALRPATGGGPT